MRTRRSIETELPCGGVEGPVECTTCRKCTSTCPAELSISDLIRLYRYGELPKGSHRDLFLLAQKMMARSDTEPWLSPSLNTGRDDIYYFPGCLPLFDDLLGWETDYARAASAGVAILNHFGVSPKVVYGCCGHDLYYSGNLDYFNLLRERLKGEIKGRVIVGCAECYHSFKELHGLDVVHISEFLKDKLAGSQKSFSSVTYHDPCRLGRYHNIYDAPRNALTSVSSLKEMEGSRENALCCGVSAWLNCNSVSKENRVRRLKEAVATGADALVTSCCKCRIHLDCVFHEEQYKGDPPKIRITDFQEHMADALGIKVPGSVIAQQCKGKRLSSFEALDDLDRQLLPGSIDNVFSCTTCERCKEVCDFDFNPVEVVEYFRQTFVANGSNPEPHKKIVEKLRQTGNAFGDERRVAKPKDLAEYVYFPGCVAISRRHSLMDDTITVLDALGVDYEIPKGLVCCGSVLKRTGYDSSFLMEQNRKIIAGRKVIASCAGCYSTLARDYGDVDVVHISQFLKGRIDGLRLNPVLVRAAYHDPCHLGRKMGIYDEPREVLRHVPGIEVVEFPESGEDAVCCGGGGGVKSGKRELANKLGKERMEEANELEAQIVATSCPFCELNLEENGSMPVLDVVEILARSLRGDSA
jgi:Fe-S oxidoreductase